MSRVAFLAQPKAGSQWIADVLSDWRVLACVPHVRFRRSDEPHDAMVRFSREADGAFVAPMFDVPHPLWSALCSPSDRAIVVGRDPRDAVVSMLYSIAYSHALDPRLELRRSVLLSLDKRRQLIVCAVMLLERSMRNFRSWAVARRDPMSYVSTYERIVADQDGEFAAMFDFLGWAIPCDVRQQAIAAHSFTVRSGGRERGEVDAFSHYRLGVAGDWRNHFDRESAQQFETAFPHLLVDLGYEHTNTWWQTVPEFSGSGSDVDDTDAGGVDASTRVREISQAMAAALRERDQRWAREEMALKERVERLEGEITSLRGTCDERLAVIGELDAHAKNLLSVCEERLALIDQQAREIERLRAAGQGAQLM